MAHDLCQNIVSAQYKKWIIFHHNLHAFHAVLYANNLLWGYALNAVCVCRGVGGGGVLCKLCLLLHIILFNFKCIQFGILKPAFQSSS